ncbi:alkaline phosphatase family protein [Loigolactobacillus bifermentans]|uniref:Sulfatase N-terminal domain-containing protein n=1 Tax=Loigolactobacillus bifermentans DSM 20003 TaxID=1423726 RepID=A0A0R1H5R6_9LACO|nr:alkaline phosphatase family protein [Loigolactobacillus bifermentans]KRK39236.1 hypothetical protein FC07_GL002484 [Loigolactobacillus bifermentans DSM 20003]QGG61455.1 sulfatase-like hydrolase/transferase [Loigolactobacillus bifermentans]
MKKQTVVTKSPLPLIPLVAGCLLAWHLVLVNSVTPPIMVQSTSRYLAYWLMVLISSVGLNLLALYLGYRATPTGQPWRQLGHFGYYLVGAGLISAVVVGLSFHELSARDLWLPWLPFSSNRFPWATGLVGWYLAGPLIARQYQRLTAQARHVFTLVLLVFMLGLPFLFGQPLWGIQTANDPLWTGSLFLLGQLFAQGELRWLTKSRLTSGIMLVTLVLAGGTAWLNPIHQTAANLTGRFYAPQQLNMALFSLALFGGLIGIAQQHWQSLQLRRWPNWLAFVSYVLATLPEVGFRLDKNLHVPANLLAGEWWLLMLGATGLFIAIVGIVTAVLMAGAHLPVIQRWLTRLTIQQASDFLKAPALVQRLARENWRLLLAIGTGLVLTFSQMIIIRLTFLPWNWVLLHTFFTQYYNRWLLNTLLFIGVFYLLFALMNRFWPALLLTSGLSVLITVSEFMKIRLRDEPILPSDLTSLSALQDVFQMVSPLLLIGAGVVLVVLIAASLVLQRHLGGLYQRSWRPRALAVVALSLLLGSTYWANQSSSFAGVIFQAFGVTPFYLNQNSSARNNGPVVQFIENLNTTAMAQPAGYSQATINQLMRKYDHVAQKLNRTRSQTLKNQTILFVLSESFSDPNRVPGLQVKPNPIPYLTQLKQQTTSGLMLSQGYGGGTANMEWQSLTGLALSNLSNTVATPYTQLVPKQKIAPAFPQLFDHRIAIHPYNATLYNRKQVFKKFGFQQFYYQGSADQLTYQHPLGSSPYVSDASAYAQALKVIKQPQKGSKFVQLSTMQNHMPYANYYGQGTFNITGNAFDSNRRDNVQTYVQGIHYTDQALKQFIHKVDNIKKPVTVVWYGDHLPSLYKTSLMTTNPIQLHETDYFIYNNQSHKLTKTHQLVSAYSFPALALSNDKLKVTPYYALLTKVTQDLPAMTTNTADSKVNSFNGGNLFVAQNGQAVSTNQLTPHQKQLYHDYQLIQYDLVAGKQYAAKWAQEK